MKSTTLRICVLCWSRDNRQTLATFVHDGDPLCERHRESEGIEIHEGTSLLSSAFERASVQASAATAAKHAPRKLREDAKCACGATLRPGWPQCAACKRADGSAGHKPSVPSKPQRVPRCKTLCMNPRCDRLCRAGNKHPFCGVCAHAGFERTEEGKKISAAFRADRLKQEAYQVERKTQTVAPVEVDIAQTGPRTLVLGNLKVETMTKAEFDAGRLDLDPLREYLERVKPEVLLVDAPEDLSVRLFLKRLGKHLQGAAGLNLHLRAHKVDGKPTGRVVIRWGKKIYPPRRRVQASAAGVSA